MTARDDPNGPAPAQVDGRRRTGIDAAADSLDEPERYLAQFYRHYPAHSEREVQFRLTRAIVLAARRWRKLADQRIRAMGQSMARWETLFLVAFSGDELTQRELARLISIEGPTMVRMLDLLAQEGLIERHQSDTDRRMTTNSVTPAGAAVVEQIKDVTDGLRAQVLHGIDPAEIETCQRVLGKIIARLDELR